MDQQRKILNQTLLDIEKKHGKGSISRYADAPKVKTEVIPTGSLALDLALGTGGMPRGRIVEIFGPEASGKTTICQHIIANAQKMGGTCAFIDAEQALDPEYARVCGMNMDELILSQPDFGEQALDIADALIRSSAVAVVVIDSVAALVPRAEIEGEMGDSHVGLHARLMSQALRKLAGIVSRSNTLLIFTNQLRMKIGVVYGNPEVTTGGNALKFYASVRLDVRGTEKIMVGTTQIGRKAKVKVVKNKLAAPHIMAEIDMLYTEGISGVRDLLNVSTRPDVDVVTKKGSFLYYDGALIGQGAEKAVQTLRDDPALFETIDRAVRAKMLKKPVIDPDDDDADGLDAGELADLGLAGPAE